MSKIARVKVLAALIAATVALALAQAQSGPTNVARASNQAFTPGATPTPGAEAALRRLLETVASGAPDYTIMTPQFASAMRTQAAQGRDLLSKLGPPTGMRFVEFNGDSDVYDVIYANATWRYTVMLDADGKLAASTILGPVTPPDPTLVPYASTKDSVRLPDGRTIHMVCMGRGSPLVILTPGGNDYSWVWNKVQPAVAEKTRVCAWERAGAGLSSPPPAPQTVAETTTDLQAALKAGGLIGPYVVVGHSRGGNDSLLLKDREPSKVVGMVLVDPQPPGFQDERDKLAPALPEWERANPNPAYLFLNKCAAAVRAGTVRRGGPDPDHCLAAPLYPPNYPQELRTALEWRFARLTSSEEAADLDSRAAVQDTGDYAERDGRASVKAGRNYGNMPLIVLTAGESTPPPPIDHDLPAVLEGLKVQEAAFRREHDALAALSTRGVNRTVPGTDHMIPQVKPQAVADAIDEVVDEARAGSAKSQKTASH
jgi:pimeloyl-ACP methyl ester carboxylesterase